MFAVYKNFIPYGIYNIVPFYIWKPVSTTLYGDLFFSAITFIYLYEFLACITITFEFISKMMIKKKKIKNIKNYRKPLTCEISSGQGSTSLSCYKNVAKCQQDFHKCVYILFIIYTWSETTLVLKKNTRHPITIIK